MTLSEKINALLPGGESLSAFRTSIECALERCKKTHKKYPSGYYNMNVATVCVSRVGVSVDESGSAAYWAEISGASCSTLNRDIYASVCGDVDIPVEVRSEW